MPEKKRPSRSLLQHVGHLLVNEPKWQDRISGWLLPIYYLVEKEDVDQIGIWRSRYKLTSWRVGLYQPMIKRRVHPLLVLKRFDKWGGDLRSSVRSLEKMRKDIKNG